MISKWTLGRRVTALCTAVAVLLGLIAITAAATAATNRTQVLRLADRIGPASSNAERLLAAVLRQQSGVRSFAASARPADLALYDDGLSAQLTVEAALVSQLSAEPALLGQLNTIRAQVSGWRTEVAQVLIDRVRARGADPAAGTPTDAERARFQQIVDNISGFQQAITKLRDQLRADVRRTGNLLTVLLLCAAIVVIAAGIALAALLRQLVTRPVLELAAQVRQVSRGSYDRAVRAEGPPEVVRLGRDVDAMRRKIVDDLAAVRRSRLALEDALRQLERQAEELTRSNRDLEQFAYVASHDLQEPLRKVASFCQLLQRRYAGQLDARADQYIKFAVDGAQRMQRLINDLLAFSRIGRITAGFTDVDLNKIVADAASQLEARREQTGGEITWGELPVVCGEEPLLSALMTNLISNSLKFHQPEEPPRVRIEARRIGDEWEISCADNGIGVDPEFADKIFVIFQRLHAKDAYQGTGIGLAIAKKILEYHGGRIWLDPEYTGGTRMVFTLPVPDSVRAAEQASPTAAAAASAAQGPPVGPAAPESEDPLEPEDPPQFEDAPELEDAAGSEGAPASEAAPVAAGQMSGEPDPLPEDTAAPGAAPGAGELAGRDGAGSRTIPSSEPSLVSGVPVGAAPSPTEELPR
jgi:signal transduction histidine kinase